MKQIKKESITIAMLISLNIIVILSGTQIELPDLLKYLIIILDIAYSFYLGRCYEFDKIIDAMKKNKK